MSMLNYLLNFTERWLGTFPRVLLTFIGVLICVLVIGALWDRRMKASAAAVGVLTGLGVVFHSTIFNILVNLQVGLRFRLFLAVLSFLLLFLTIQAIRTSSLRKRYAMIWLVLCAVLSLMTASPIFLHSLESFFGMPASFLLSGGGLVFLFILVFDFSIELTKLQKQQLLLEERCTALEKLSNVQAFDLSGTVAPTATLPSITKGQEAISELKNSIFSTETVGRAIRGTYIGAPLVIFLAVLSVLLVGLAAPQAMVGDEVTHYYMVVKQAQDISKPNFYSDIPMATGGIETRRYPHSFIWHYFGALVYLVTGGSFAGVQLYQAFFLLQLLTIAYLLSVSRGGIESRSALLYVLVLASLPLCLIFSVTFYQDVPMTAQALTAFYLLSRRKWLLASLFMALAIGFKVTAVLFFPAFFVLLFNWETKNGSFKHGLFALGCSALIVLGSTWTLGKAINIYGQAAFYPQEKFEILTTVVKNKLGGLFSNKDFETVAQVIDKKQRSAAQFARNKSLETAPVIIANHPGDLRIKDNYLVYGGLLLWLIIITGGVTYLPMLLKRYPRQENHSSKWLVSVGGSFLLITWYMTRTAPDARFFLPALPFLLLPLVERVVRIRMPKLIITLLATLAVLQCGYVLNKAYRLRVVTPEILEGINYLKTNPPIPQKIFMYPEGNYRLFPVPHEWYLDFRLREFWRADNDTRIEMLRNFGIGAIVIKKQLIAEVDQEITNLGVYPTQFVDDLVHDKRFVNVFENGDLMIFLPPFPGNIHRE